MEEEKEILIYPVLKCLLDDVLNKPIIKIKFKQRF